jgi:hypothetical protein
MQTFTELEQLPATMADAVRPLLGTADLAGYQRFLAAMAHYTRRSGQRLEHAARHADAAPLRQFFAQLAREESHHYRLAEADLATFGRVPTADVPAAVQEFHDCWMSAASPAVWLGALYVLENVGGHLQQAAMQNLGRLGLRAEQVRFVRVHLEADADHGRATAEHARLCAQTDGVALLSAATKAAAFWVGLHRRAFAPDDAAEGAPGRPGGSADGSDRQVANGGAGR